MIGAWLIAVAVASASAAEPAPPAAAASPDDTTITVTAGRLTPEELHARAVAFVGATGVAAGEVPAARWVEPVCPRAVGLTERSAAVVEAKLRTIAAAAGIKVAVEPCTANIAVMFATDPGAVVRGIIAKAPSRVAEVPRGALAELTGGAAPVRWWYSSEVRDKGGAAATSTQSVAMVAAKDSTGIGLPGNEETTFVSHYSTSLISTENVRALRAATVVIDGAQIKGIPLDAVAGFAAMVTFAEIRRGAAPPGSILGLFSRANPPAAATAWDFGFLRALYRLPLDRTAARHRGQLTADLIAAVKP